jgi:hypothetical protein
MFTALGVEVTATTITAWLIDIDYPNSGAIDTRSASFEPADVGPAVADVVRLMSERAEMHRLSCTGVGVICEREFLDTIENALRADLSSSDITVVGPDDRRIDQAYPVVVAAALIVAHRSGRNGGLLSRRMRVGGVAAAAAVLVVGIGLSSWDRGSSAESELSEPAARTAQAASTPAPVAEATVVGTARPERTTTVTSGVRTTVAPTPPVAGSSFPVANSDSFIRVEKSTSVRTPVPETATIAARPAPSPRERSDDTGSTAPKPARGAPTPDVQEPVVSPPEVPTPDAPPPDVPLSVATPDESEPLVGQQPDERTSENAESSE